MEARRMETRATRVAGMEHRWGRRITCGAPIRIGAMKAIGTGRLRDVSLSGAFVETTLELALFAPIAVVVHETEVLAHVVRIADDGVGIEWRVTAPQAICPLLGCVSLCTAARDSAG